MMLLGFILGGSSGLPSRLAGLLQQMRVADPLQYNPPARWRTFIAPTAQDPYRGRLLVGEPDDANAWALDGAAGHAGMFGTAPAVGAFARHLLQVLDGRTGAFQRGTLETFIARRDDVPGSTRARGWDTMKETSSCGSQMSPRAFGHPGYTGTSLWIDPERGVYAVLLTNRVHPARTNFTIREVRRAFHDAVFDALD
jgi:CubicO group peptidase (beta-lactamase class C family)